MLDGESTLTKKAAEQFNGWAGRDSEIADHVAALTRQCLGAYRANPLLVQEHANIERATAQGGYGRRQLYELVQNGADALLGHKDGRIHVVLTTEALYCANQGAPITRSGTDAILSSHLSVKRGSEIGRFGLGFKSVLGVTTRPEFYSRTGSFGFDREHSEQTIRKVVGDAERFPILRIAKNLDPRAAARRDPLLAELMQWATTVVKLPRDLSSTSWLSEDIVNFPADFLLFSSHVATLVLEDRIKSFRREIRQQIKDGFINLDEDGAPSVWQVFSTTHIPSEEAKKEAGELADRDALPLMWAVPLKGERVAARGQFWAFFPTEYLTTLSGVINAPWKTNEDRQNLLNGLFNGELISAAAKLVATSLAKISTLDDPGRFLDLMPARGREAPNWADAKLTEEVYKYAAAEPILPDQHGRRLRVHELHLHPAGLPREALEMWASYEGRPSHWCHHAIETPNRRSRVERLLLLVGRQPASIAGWLEALVADKSSNASAAAIQAASAIVTSPASTGIQKEQVQKAKIVLTKHDHWVCARPGAVFVGHDKDIPELNVELVHSRLAALEPVRRALKGLGIGEVEASSELEALLVSGALSGRKAAEWASFWELVSRVPLQRALELINQHAKGRSDIDVHVRTLAGTYRPLKNALLPGEIVPSDGSRDRFLAIDERFHQGALPILQSLGATDSPKLGHGEASGKWWDDYRREAVKEFYRLLPQKGPRPQEAHLFIYHDEFVGPLDVLAELSDESRARYTERLLFASIDEHTCILRHDTRSDSYPKVEMPPPSVWFARREGRLRTSMGIVPVATAVGAEMAEWAKILPVANCSADDARRLDLPTDTAALTDKHWQAGLESARQCEDDRLLCRFYAEAAYRGRRIPKIKCRQGAKFVLRRPSDVVVAYLPNELRVLAAAELPYLAAASQIDAERLVEILSLRPASEVVTVSVYFEQSGPELPLADRFPALQSWLADDQTTATLIPCSTLRIDSFTENGKTGEDRRLIYQDGKVYVSDQLVVGELLDLICEEFEVRLPIDQRQSILEQRALMEQRALIVSIRTKDTLAERLLAAVGADAIRRRLPVPLVSIALETYGTVTDLRAAQLAMAVYGLETLGEFKDELQRNGLTPPVKWAGSYLARKFVQELGFPKEYAGFEQARREAVVEVEGPPNLPPLHKFQAKIVGRMHRLLDGKGKLDSKRGLLSLPTGAGKTRVAVESLVRRIRDGRLGGPILWVAQTDELCEQAVQTWSEVWRGLGTQVRLRINRLWASNEADAYDEGVQIVIATDAKLIAACVNKPEYEWLKEATCVIIDEAHGSTGPSYTAILEWLGLGRGADRCPLIGLTATPFKGGEEETIRLVRRYGQNRLDRDVLGDEPYRQLQDMKVLANVEHRLLEGETIVLSEAELADLRRLHTLPASVNDRIGASASRNQVLLDSIKELPPNWPVLLFAASVDHARAMAAILTAEGISAAAISAGTEPGARRHYIERFRRGELRVLANYAVLTAGFDAPSIRALYVARPTYSPVMYQQMIGRGLRGPLNGGKETCLIVNVKDNLAQFGEELAFTQFEFLWKK